MESPESPSVPAKPVDADRAQKIRHLPESAQAAYRSFQASGDPAVLDPLIFAIVESFIPRKRERSLAQHPGNLRLIEDLGFDSLAISEVVFFTEDLLEITIANEEIVQVLTLDDLRCFVSRKVAARRPA